MVYRLCKKSHTTPRIYSHLITSCPYLIITVIFHISPQCANTLFTLVSFPSGARVFPFHMRVPYCGGLDIRRDRNASWCGLDKDAPYSSIYIYIYTCWWWFCCARSWVNCSPIVFWNMFNCWGMVKMRVLVCGFLCSVGHVNCNN